MYVRHLHDREPVGARREFRGLDDKPLCSYVFRLEITVCADHQRQAETDEETTVFAGTRYEEMSVSRHPPGQTGNEADNIEKEGAAEKDEQCRHPEVGNIRQRRADKSYSCGSSVRTRKVAKIMSSMNKASAVPAAGPNAKALLASEEGVDMHARRRS